LGFVVDAEAGFFSGAGEGFALEAVFAGAVVLELVLEVLAEAGFDESSSSSFFFFDVSAAKAIHEVQAHSHTAASSTRDGRWNTGGRVSMSGRQITREGRIRNGAETIIRRSILGQRELR
jgi:hypothetical protein